MYRFYKETNKKIEFLFVVKTLNEAIRLIETEVDKLRKEKIGTVWERDVLWNTPIADESFEHNGMMIYSKRVRYWQHPCGNYTELYFIGHNDC